MSAVFWILFIVWDLCTGICEIAKCLFSFFRSLFSEETRENDHERRAYEAKLSLARERVKDIEENHPWRYRVELIVFAICLVAIIGLLAYYLPGLLVLLLIYCLYSKWRESRAEKQIPPI